MSQETFTVETNSHDGGVAVAADEKIVFADTVHLSVQCDSGAPASMAYSARVLATDGRTDDPGDSAQENADGTWTLEGEVLPGNSDSFVYTSSGPGVGLLSFSADVDRQHVTLRVNGYPVRQDSIPPALDALGESDVSFEIALHDDASVDSMVYCGHVHGENVSVPYDTVEQRGDDTWRIDGEVWAGNSDTFTWTSPGAGPGILGFDTETPEADYTVRVNGFAVPHAGLPPLSIDYGGGGYGN